MVVYLKNKTAAEGELIVGVSSGGLTGGKKILPVLSYPVLPHPSTFSKNMKGKMGEIHIITVHTLALF